MSERQFRRYRDRYEEDGVDGLVDGRLGRPSPRRVPAADVGLMLELYRHGYRGWNVKHFHEHLVRDHDFRWGYTWVKTQLHTAGLVERARRRGAHRRKRERKPWEGMMLHQDGSRAAWLAGRAQLDLIVTMDDATSTIYAAFLIEEEGTVSTFRALLDVFTAHGLPSSLYTRSLGSRHYFYTRKADGPVRGQGPADPGRPGAEAPGRRARRGLFAGGAGALGADVRHVAGPADQGTGEGRHPRDRARSPTLDPGRLPAPGAQCTVRQAGRASRRAHSWRPIRRFSPRPCASRRSGWWPVTTPSPMTTAGCNCPPAERAPTTSRPTSRCANTRTARLSAVFHGPRCIARYSAQGEEIAQVPFHHPKRDTVLAAVKAWPVEAAARKTYTATAILDRRGGCARRHRECQAGRDEETALGSNKETDQKDGAYRTSRNLIRHRAGASTASKPAMRITTRSGHMMCYENRTT